MTLKLSEHGLCAVQGIEQPEQRHIRHGKIGHALVTFTTHVHQATQTGTQLRHQLFQLGHQPAAALQSQQGRKKGFIGYPAPL
ncbi:hypothetical protein D3C72_1549370 [compost metagenome]